MDRPRNLGVLSPSPGASSTSLGGTSEDITDSPRSAPVLPAVLSPDQRLVKLGHAITFLNNHTYPIGARTGEDLTSIDLFNSESMPDEVRDTIVRAVASAASWVAGEFGGDRA